MAYMRYGFRMCRFLGLLSTFFQYHALCAQNLTDNFRYEYAQLWISILNRDTQHMFDHCAALGVGDLFWLFASMVTGRSWDAIRTGINTTKFDASEVRNGQNHWLRLFDRLIYFFNRRKNWYNANFQIYSIIYRTYYRKQIVK